MELESTSPALRLGPGVAGIAAGAAHESVVVTQGGSVQLYSLGRREKLAGWRLDEADSRLCGAPACDALTGTLHAIVSASGSHQLLSWNTTSEEGNLARVATRTSLPKPVHSIHSAAPSARPAGGEAAVEAAGVFIVFADGTVALDSGFRNGQVRAPLGQPARAEAASAHSGRLAVATTADTQPGVLTVYETQDRQLRQLASRALPRSDAPSGVSIHEATVAVVWADGDALTLLLRPGANSVAELSQMARRRLAGFAALQDATPVKALRPTENGIRRSTPGGKRKGRGRASAAAAAEAPGPCVAALPAGQTAVLGWTGAGAAGKLRIVLLDSRLGVPQAVRELPARQLGGSTADSPLQVLSRAGGQAVLLAAGGLLSLTLEGPQPTLASQLGALAPGSGAAAQALHAEELARARPPLQSRQLPRWLPGPAAAQPQPQPLSSEVALPIDTRDSDAGSPASLPGLRELEELEEAVRDPGGLQDASAAADAFLQACQLSAGERRAIWVPDSLAALLLTRLAERGHWDAFAKVWASRPLPSLARVPGLLPLLVKAGQHRLVARILPAVGEVPADDLRDVLRLLLGSGPTPAAAAWHAELRAAARAAVEAAEAGGSQEVAAAADAVAAVQRFSPQARLPSRAERGYRLCQQRGHEAACLAQEVLLHPLVAAPADDTLLGRALRGLSASQALRLARYLRRWLANLTELDASRGGAQTPAGAVVPSVAGVLRWLNRLLDAHAVGLATVPAAPQLVRALQESARANLAGLQVLGPLQGALHHMQRKQPLPGRQRPALDYSIELLDIGVRS